MRKSGENPERITHTQESFPVDVWQNYASPVWMDIKQSNTLQKKSARAEKDERHICPLQLDVIQRCIELWTNPKDIVFDPFGGIGSSPYVALTMNRRAIACELKESYFKQIRNEGLFYILCDWRDYRYSNYIINPFITWTIKASVMRLIASDIVAAVNVYFIKYLLNSFIAKVHTKVCKSQEDKR